MFKLYVPGGRNGGGDGATGVCGATGGYGGPGVFGRVGPHWEPRDYECCGEPRQTGREPAGRGARGGPGNLNKIIII